MVLCAPLRLRAAAFGGIMQHFISLITNVHTLRLEDRDGGDGGGTLLKGDHN